MAKVYMQNGSHPPSPSPRTIPSHNPYLHCEIPIIIYWWNYLFSIILSISWRNLAVSQMLSDVGFNNNRIVLHLFNRLLYFLRTASSNGHSKIIWFSSSTTLQFKHTRSSRVIIGLAYLPVSTFSLWFDKRQREITALW